MTDNDDNVCARYNMEIFNTDQFGDLRGYYWRACTAPRSLDLDGAVGPFATRLEAVENVRAVYVEAAWRKEEEAAK